MSALSIIKKKEPKKFDLKNKDTVRTALIEFCIYLFFLTVTTIVALSSRHLYMYYFNKTIYDMFLSTDLRIFYQDSVLFDQIVTTADWWNFLEYTVLPELHGSTGKTENMANPQGDVNPQDEVNPQDAVNTEVDGNPEGDNAAEGGAKGKDKGTGEGVSVDEHKLLRENLLLGPPRLRQIRVQKDSCNVHSAFQRYFDACYAEYAQSIEDQSEEFKGTQFYTLGELSALSLWAKFGSYRGGGYIKDLTYSYEQNEKLFKELKAVKWIDRSTRVILLEFTLYNANTELFDSVKFIGEIPPTGGVIPSYQIQAVKLNSIWTEGNYFVLLAAIFVYILAIYYAVEESLDIHRMGCLQYVRSIWNLVDFFIIMLVVLSFVYNIWHPVYLNSIMQTLANQPEKYQSLDIICFWNLVYIDMMGILTFIVWMKIFKYISFNKTLLQFRNTFKRCAKDVAGFGVMFMIVFLAYAQLGLLLFGMKHPDFRDFKQSFLTMMRMVLGDFDYSAIEEANRVLGPIFFLSFTMLVFFILLNMFLAIIAETYSQVKNEIQHGQNQMIPFIKEKFAQLVALMKKLKDRIRKKKTKEQPVETHKEEKTESAQNHKEDESIIDMTPEDAKTGPTMYPRSSTMSEKTSKTLPLRVRESEVFSEFFEEVDMAKDSEELKRLTQRVVLVENVMEQLIISLDHILKKVEEKNNAKG